jgi:hypothetical protein
MAPSPRRNMTPSPRTRRYTARSPTGSSRGPPTPIAEEVLRFEDRGVVRRINTFLDESDSDEKVVISGALFRAEMKPTDAEVKAAWTRYLSDLVLDRTLKEMIRSILKEKRSVRTANDMRKK